MIRSPHKDKHRKPKFTLKNIKKEWHKWSLLKKLIVFNVLIISVLLIIENLIGLEDLFEQFSSNQTVIERDWSIPQQDPIIQQPTDEL